MSKAMVWTGRVLSTLLVLALLAGIVFAFAKPDDVKKQMAPYGYPANSVMPIVVAEACCVILYAIPQTSVLGAILLTGYLGGAVSTHVRAGESTWWMAVLVGVIAWLALLLREPRLKGLLPLRR